MKYVIQTPDVTTWESGPSLLANLSFKIFPVGLLFFSSISSNSSRDKCCTMPVPMASPMTLTTVMKRSLRIDKNIHSNKAFELKWESEEENIASNFSLTIIKFFYARMFSQKRAFFNTLYWSTLRLSVVKLEPKYWQQPIRRNENISWELKIKTSKLPKAREKRVTNSPLVVVLNLFGW